MPHGEYAIIDAFDEFFLMRHSVNRNSADTMTPLEFMYESPASKIAQILVIDSLIKTEGPEDSSLQLLVAHKTRIENFTILPPTTDLPQSIAPLRLSNYSLSSFSVQCLSAKPGRLPLTV